MPMNDEASQTGCNDECLFQYVGNGLIKVSPGFLTPADIYAAGKPSYKEWEQIAVDYRRYYEELYPFGISKHSRTRLSIALALATTWLIFNLAFDFRALYPIAAIAFITFLIARAKIRFEGFMLGLKGGTFLGLQRAFNLTDQEANEIRDVHFGTEF